MVRRGLVQAESCVSALSAERKAVHSGETVVGMRGLADGAVGFDRVVFDAVVLAASVVKKKSAIVLFQ